VKPALRISTDRYWRDVLVLEGFLALIVYFVLRRMFCMTMECDPVRVWEDYCTSMGDDL
jgi:hypothetical protein